MLMIKIPRRFSDFIYIFVLIYSSLFPPWALGSVSDLRLKTLLNIALTRGTDARRKICVLKTDISAFAEESRNNSVETRSTATQLMQSIA